MPLPSGKTIRINGIVQGVGFRPFVRNLAVRLGLTGTVLNDSRGVTIRVFGAPERLDAFLSELNDSPPPLASIRSVRIETDSGRAPDGFTIIQSDDAGTRTVAVTPDARLCADCLRELRDPSDRRYRYPFINCTNCGPRYTIIEDVPYDRPNTTMRDFIMCDACRAEYENPDDRRYHAQPVCCPDCGPRVQFVAADGTRVSGDPIRTAGRWLAAGKILAIKGLGGFHLACDAQNPAAVDTLRLRKHRDEKPLAVMAKDESLAQKLVQMPGYGKRLLTGTVAPILIAPKRKDGDRVGLAPGVAPVTDSYGVMLPYTPLHVLLFDDGPDYLVMTSANLTDEPICITNDEARRRLDGIADGYLIHDRRINLRVDDSVLMSSEDRPTIIRRARGYVPSGIETGRSVDGIAGYGPLLKNTPAVGRDTTIYPGQHIGDLNNVAALDMFHDVLNHLTAILGVRIERVACDMHPDYPTTRMAEASGMPYTAVQHHHAHLVSLMAETRVYEKSIGFALDGTGYGDDGRIWGGEVMVFDPAGYRRCYHLEYVPLPGGDMAIKEPWRMAVSYLVHNGIDYEKYVTHARAGSVAALLSSGIRHVSTSSAGRLFDAVSSVLGLCDESTFEAKAPMALEGIVAPVDDRDYYGFSLENGVIRTGDIIHGVTRDIDAGVPAPVISGRFHNTIVEIIVSCARAIRETDGLNTVFLSGGVLMNAVISGHARKRLQAAGFAVHTHTLLPPGDGGVSTGQILVAAANV